MAQFFQRVAILANSHTLMVDSDVGGVVLGPASGVVVLEAVARQAESFVSVPAENTLRIFRSCVCERSSCDFCCETEPCCIEALKKTNHSSLTERHFLQAKVQR